MNAKLLGNLSTGLLFIISAPAGTGKTTLVRMLADEFPCVVASISATTRQARPGEIDGKDYHFLSQEDFLKRLNAGEFIEHVHLFGHYYGTSYAFVKQQQVQGKHVLLVIDTKGAQQIKGMMEAISIFIAPPSLAELTMRLERRKTESSEVIQERLAKAEEELKYKSAYDYTFVNADLMVAYQVLRSILIAEEHRVRYTNALVH